jgi:hypothetical protein
MFPTDQKGANRSDEKINTELDTKHREIRLITIK